MSVTENEDRNNKTFHRTEMETNIYLCGRNKRATGQFHYPETDEALNKSQHDETDKMTRVNHVYVGFQI